MAAVIGLCLIIPSFALPIVNKTIADPVVTAPQLFVFPKSLSEWTLATTDAPNGWYNLSLDSAVRVTDTTVSPVIHAIQNNDSEPTNLFSESTHRIYVDGTIRLTLTNAVANEWRPIYGLLVPLNEPNVPPGLPWDLPVHINATSHAMADAIWVAGLDLNSTIITMTINGVDSYCSTANCEYNMVRYAFSSTVINSLAVSSNIPFENYIVGTRASNAQNMCECV